MILADDLIKLGKAKTILVIGGETLSRVTDPFDRNKMILLAFELAVVLQKSEQKKTPELLRLPILQYVCWKN